MSVSQSQPSGEASADAEVFAGLASEPAAATQTDWKGVVPYQVTNAIASAIEPVVRRASEDIYDQLLATAMEYLSDNLRFNIGSTIQAAERQALSDRLALRTEQAKSAELLSALQGLRDILGRAESNASGNPEWEAVSARINTARAAIAKATGQ